MCILILVVIYASHKTNEAESGEYGVGCILDLYTVIIVIILAQKPQ